MAFIDTLHRLEKLDQLIRFQKTGTPKDLAKKMEISERTLYRDIEYLKILGGPIYYSEDEESYYYEEKNQGRLYLGYFKKIIHNE
jgi:predicted DNA-binding transcriptional regulator YafY